MNDITNIPADGSPATPIVVSYSGRAFPEGIQVTVQGLDPIEIILGPGAPKITANLSIATNIIKVTFEVSRWSPSMMEILMGHAFRLSRTAVSIMGYRSGEALQVIIDGWWNAAGKYSGLVMAKKSLMSQVTALDIPAVFNEVVRFSMVDRAFNLVLSDLVSSLASPDDDVISLARAADGLRHLIAGPKLGTKQGWAVVRDRLNLDEAFVRLITDNSAEHRHGNRVYIPDVVRNEIAMRAWRIMDRYLYYRIGGNAPLPTEYFPLLRG